MTVTSADLDSAITSGDATAIATVASSIADQQSAPDLDFRFTICEKFWEPIGNPLSDLMEASGTDPRNAVGSMQMKLKGNSTLVPALMNCRQEMVGVKVETAGLRYGYYVNLHEYDYKDGTWISTSTCRSIFDILSYMIVLPQWWLPIATQLFSHAVFVGPIVTVVETMIAQCALRIQSGWGDFVNNFLSLNLDVRSWFGTLLQSNGNLLEMLKTPMYVVRTNPLLDTSPTVAKTVRMETCASVISELCEPYGVDVDVSLWLPGDDQPDTWANLDQPTYVVRVKDRSQIDGPTKTVLDSALRTLVDAEGALLGNVLDPILNPRGDYPQGTLPPGQFTAPALGVNFTPPYAIIEAPEPGGDSPLLTCTIVDHSPKGWRQILGGKSPKWLTDTIQATTAWLIDSASIILGFTGIPSNMLDGFLADSFMAFQLFDHYPRRDSMGPYHPAMEVMTPTPGTYDIETLFTLTNKLFQSRGFTSAVFTFRDGIPYKIGRDIFRGGLVSLVYQNRTRIFTDYITNIMWRITPTDREITCQVSDNKDVEPPLARIQRFVTGLEEAVNVLTLAPRT